MSEFLRETVDLGRETINPVNIVPSVVVGLAVFFILLMIVNITIYNYNPDEYKKYDAHGCLVDINGNVLAEPIYQKNSNGKYTNTIIGTDTCIEKTNKLWLYGLSFIITALAGLIAGSGMHKLMFIKANPRISSAATATSMFKRALFN